MNRSQAIIEMPMTDEETEQMRRRALGMSRRRRKYAHGGTPLSPQPSGRFAVETRAALAKGGAK